MRDFPELFFNGDLQSHHNNAHGDLCPEVVSRAVRLVETFGNVDFLFFLDRSGFGDNRLFVKFCFSVSMTIDALNKQAAELISQLEFIKTRLFKHPALTSVTGKLPPAESGVRTLGLAISDQLIRHGRVDLRGHEIKTSTDLAELAQVYRDPRLETLRIFYIKNNQIVSQEGVTSRMPGFASAFVGKDNQARFMWKMRHRIKRLSADGYYILHNHPSGRVTASEADAGLTYLIAENIPGFKGHIIIDSGEYHIMKFSGPDLVSETRRLKSRPAGWQDPLFQPAIPHEQLGTAVITAEDIAAVGKEIQTSPDSVTLIYRDGQGLVRAIQEAPPALMNKPEHAADYILGQIRCFGAFDVIAFAEKGDTRIINEAAEARLIKDKVLTDIVYGSRGGLGDTYTGSVIAGRDLGHIDLLLGRPMQNFRTTQVNDWVDPDRVNIS